MNSGFMFPGQCITVSIGPAELTKRR
ncbi:hypothetical protein [Candidatus Williamhamiltonella defendens]|nr:hypothetical protein [Candidatus Hamiltonella defensa]